MIDKPAELSQKEWNAWPQCQIEECENKCCLAIGSEFCHDHAGVVAAMSQAAHTASKLKLIVQRIEQDSGLDLGRFHCDLNV